MKAKHWALLAFFVVFTWTLWVWYLRGTRQLCNGYRLLWMNGAEAVIADPHEHILTSGTVTHYSTSCPMIAGYTSKRGFSADTEPVEGYFIIDTETGTSTLGMTEAEWSERLRVAHWQHPNLHATHPTKLPETTE